MIMMIYECEVQCSLTESQMWVLDQRWNRLFSTLLLPTRNSLYIHTVHTVKCLLIWSWWFSAKGNLYPIKTVTFSTFKATRPQYACMIFIIIFSTLVHGMEFLAKYSWKSWLSWLLKVCMYLANLWNYFFTNIHK